MLEWTGGPSCPDHAVALTRECGPRDRRRFTNGTGTRGRPVGYTLQIAYHGPTLPSFRFLPQVTRAARALAVGFTSTLGVLVLVSACAPSSSPVGPGGECFLATDCASGLICIEQPNKTRVCSDDLSRVAGRPPPAGDAGADDGSLDGSVPDSSPPLPDTGVPDTNQPPPDTGAPPADSGGD
jgi:hypothetical protein